MKYLVMLFAHVASLLFSVRKTRELIFALMEKVIAKNDPETALRFLLELDSQVARRTHHVGIDYDGGTHPGHRIINYKQFYIDRVTPDDVVLDVGSHCGDIVRAMAEATGARIIGVELLEDRVAEARRRNPHPNVRYICGDALELELDEPVSVIVLSAVLEHIEPRIDFLNRLQERYNPRSILIRVPMITRDWRVPLRKELGMRYTMDSTHYIEYTRQEFEDEMARAGLNIDELYVEFGEIYASVSPKRQRDGKSLGQAAGEPQTV